VIGALGDEAIVVRDSYRCCYTNRCIVAGNHGGGQVSAERAAPTSRRTPGRANRSTSSGRVVCAQRSPCPPRDDIGEPEGCCREPLVDPASGANRALYGRSPSPNRWTTMDFGGRGCLEESISFLKRRPWTMMD
jgi:hypothetical protein